MTNRIFRRAAVHVVASMLSTTPLTVGATGIAQAQPSTPAQAPNSDVSASRFLEAPSASPTENVTPVQRPEDAVEAVRRAGPKTWAVLGGLCRYPNGETRTVKIDLENLDGPKVTWKRHYDNNGVWFDTDDPNIDQSWRKLDQPWYKIVPVPLSR